MKNIKYKGVLESKNLSDMLNKSSTTTTPLGNMNVDCESMYLFTDVKNLGTNIYSITVDGLRNFLQLLYLI